MRGKARVIAINDAYKLAPWADVLYSSDRRWFPHYHGVPEFTGMKYGIGSTVGKDNPFHGLPAITVLKNTGPEGVELEPSGLRSGSNSGYAAINLAVHFGASRILLLGYNLNQHGGRLHFFGNHPPGLPNQPWLLQNFKARFHSLVAPLQALGVEVINCTPHSSLDAFPMADLRDVLKAREVAA